MQHSVWRRYALWSATAVFGALSLLSCGGSSDAPTPPTYGTTVVLGASISDTGNSCRASSAACPPSPPYAAGRFSNGPLWIEAVAAHFGGSASPFLSGGTNYAYAGARTGSVRSALDTAGLQSVTLSSGSGTEPSVPGMNSALGVIPSQLDQLLARFNYQIPPQTLVIIDASTVGNNIADALTLSALFPGQAANIPTAIVTGAVTDIVGIINRLYAAGARTMVVLNVPNIGQTPRVQAIGGAAIAGATQLSTAFNTALGQQITGLRNVMAGTNIVLFDLFALEAQIKGGTAPGFTLVDTTNACFTPTPTPAVCGAPATYFYWDSFHPTAAVGAYLATRVIAAIP